MSVVMGASREATPAARLMAEKEVVGLPAAAAAAAAAVCGMKRGFSVGRAIVEVDEGGGGEEGELSSEMSSSIGEAEEDGSSVSLSTSVDGGEEAEVQSRWSKGASSSLLGSMESLEEALPIKRGLSSFFNGKSKSFATLSDASSASTAARGLAKPENPFNKRRRILVSSKPSWRRRASYGSLLWSSSSSSASSSPASVPTASNPDLSSLESEEEEVGEYNESRFPPSPTPLQPPLLPFHQGIISSSSKNAFRSPRSFSLSDLRQHARKC